jgi:hypothetical protein
MPLPNINGFGIVNNPLIDGVFEDNNEPGTIVPANDFLLMNGDYFLLQNGQNFLLMAPM